MEDWLAQNLTKAPEGEFISHTTLIRVLEHSNIEVPDKLRLLKQCKRKSKSGPAEVPGHGDLHERMTYEDFKKVITRWRRGAYEVEMEIVGIVNSRLKIEVDAELKERLGASLREQVKEQVLAIMVPMVVSDGMGFYIKSMKKNITETKDRATTYNQQEVNTDIALTKDAIMAKVENDVENISCGIIRKVLRAADDKTLSSGSFMFNPSAMQPTPGSISDDKSEVEIVNKEKDKIIPDNGLKIHFKKPKEYQQLRPRQLKRLAEKVEKLDYVDTLVDSQSANYTVHLNRNTSPQEITKLQVMLKSPQVIDSDP